MGLYVTTVAAKATEKFVYVKTRKAVMENERGKIILRLNAPSKLKVIADEAKGKLHVEVEGWISESDITKVEEGIYRISISNLERLWATSIDASWGHKWYYEAIGDITDETVMISTGETYASQDKDTVCVKVRVTGWIQSQFVTMDFADTHKLGQIHGRILQNGLPAAGIRVSLSEQSQDTDKNGEYRFTNLFPNREHKLYIKKEGKSYSLLGNHPILDPGEVLRYQDIDISYKIRTN